MTRRSQAPRVHGFASRLLATSIVALAGLVSMSASASATVIHPFLAAPTKAISEAANSCGSEQGPLEEVSALAIGPSEQVGEEAHLWIGEQIHEGPSERVDELSAGVGACESQLEHVPTLQKAYEGGIAVGHGTGERQVYVGTHAQEGVEGNVVAVFGPSGTLQATWTNANTPAGPFGAPFGEPTGSFHVTAVAVDESGNLSDWAKRDVVVAKAGVGAGGVVSLFQPAVHGGKTLVRQLRGTCLSPPAVCSTTEEEEHPFTTAEAVAVEPSSGDLLVADGDAVDRFEPTGLGEYRYLGQITKAAGTPFGAPIVGLASGGGKENSDIYAAEEGGSTVKQFDFEGDYLGTLGGTSVEEEPAAAFLHVTSIAVDAASGRVFIGDGRSRQEEPGAVDVFGPDVIVPGAKTEAATEVTASTAVLNGTVDPAGEGAAGCEFEYGTSTAYGQRVKCAASVPGPAPEPVRSLTVAGLLPDTTYHFRLDATDANGTSKGNDQTFTTKGPGIVAESASDVSGTAATLSATIKPDGVATSYLFQYGESTAYGHDAPQPPGTAIGAGSEPVAVGPQQILGLSAGTVYHYRVVAFSEVEVTPGHVELHEFDGEDHTFTTQSAPATVLADNRQWQLVSPPDKYGALITPLDMIGGTNGDVIQASPDGDAVTYVADAPTEAAPEGNSNLVQVFSARGPDGWMSHDLTLPHLGVTRASVASGNEYQFFSEDLSAAVVQPFGKFVACASSGGAPQPCLSPEASEQTAFLHSNYLEGDPAQPCTTSCYRPLVTGKPPFANVPEGTVFGEYGEPKHTGGSEGGTRCPPYLICGPAFQGATADDRHVVVGSPVQLTATSTENHPAQLYEWTGAAPRSSQVRLVSVLPEAEGGGTSPEGALLGGEQGEDARNAISDDGARVFFTIKGGGGVALYVRDLGLGNSLRIGTPEPECLAAKACGQGEVNAEFQFASTDGSRVYFTDAQRLTANSGARSGHPDLYECTLTVTGGHLGCKLTDLTPRSTAGEAASVQGAVLGASEDGSRLYFVANGILDSGGAPVQGATSGNCSTITPAAACTLYTMQDGAISAVAVLSGEDLPDWTGRNGIDLASLTARVSPDGEWLAFMSDRSLTGYNNRDMVSERPDEEVYLYHAATGKLLCASCDPTGARPIGTEYGSNGHNLPVVGGNEVWEASSWLAANVPGWTPYRQTNARYQSRYLSNSGRVFFNARDPLVPEAVNHSWNVYEFEPAGVPADTGHECAGGTTGFEATADGCVSLVSSGEAPGESEFLDASESGGDVFFLTAGRLLPGQDKDSSYDVYDAHECTGASPCLPGSAEQPPACVTADACRAAPSAQPEVFGAPSSATFSGVGNVPPAAKPVVVRSLTRAQKLAKALKACRKDRKKSNRAGCEKRARAAYGPARAMKKPKARKSDRASNNRGTN